LLDRAADSGEGDAEEFRDLRLGDWLAGCLTSSPIVS